MRSELVIDVRLSDGRVVRLQPLTFRQSLAAAEARQASEVPDAISEETWVAFWRIHYGMQEGEGLVVLEPGELLDLLEGDTGALIDAWSEVHQRAASFRRGEAVVVPDRAGHLEGDGVVDGGAGDLA